MSAQETAPKTLLMPIWLVFKKTKDIGIGWEPVGAFLSKGNADAWSNKEFGVAPQLDMNGWNTTVYAARSPMLLQHTAEGFMVNAQLAMLPVIDLNASPEALPLIEAVLIVTQEHRVLFNNASEGPEEKDRYNRARALMSALTDDDFYMAPKTLPKVHR